MSQHAVFVATEYQNTIQEVLIACDNSTEAFRRLYQQKKQGEHHFSLAFIARECGVSKGYVSDVMSGRRLLSKKHWLKFLSLFDLSPSMEYFFRLLLSRDSLKSLGEIQSISEEIEAQRKALSITKRVIPKKVRGLLYSFELLCAFGLFGNRPSKTQLREYYGAKKGVELDIALHLLKSKEFIDIAEDGHYYLLKEHIGFFDSEDGLTHKDFMKESIRNAISHVDEFHLKRDEAIYETAIISVKKDEYCSQLDAFRSQLHRMQTDMETGHADTLIRFNIQLFPLGHR